jgi:Hypothetical protein TT1725
MIKLVGVDVYLQSETLPDVPKEHGKLKLTFISNKGTRIWPGDTKTMSLLDLMQCRYESDADLNDADITDLLNVLDKNFKWSKAQKLIAKDGEKLYSQPY